MRKINNKGFTIVEIVVTFSMIMFFCIGLLVIVFHADNVLAAIRRDTTR